MRIVSLLPSATEIVYALGYGTSLVGRSHECDFPSQVRRLPAVTRPRFDPEGSSREIDARVKRLAARSPEHDALGVYAVDEDLLRQLRPTHIVTQTRCEVCAVSLRDVEAAAAKLTGAPVTIVSLEPNRLDDVWQDFRRTAAALGDPAAGERLVARTLERIGKVESQVRELPRPRVAGIEWIDPLMSFGNWTPALIGSAGGECLLGRDGEHSPWIAFEQLTAADPDVIVAAPCGFGIARARQETPLLTARPEWKNLKAARARRAYVADGNQFFNRPGPRLAVAVEILAEMLHPGRFDFGWRGVGWESLEP